MEVTPLTVPTRKLHCGSLRVLLTGKAANTNGSTSKDINLKSIMNVLYFDQLLELYECLVPWF
ncbi:unnamed protein product [Trifolium pratense]|uniref:Uncharacterized protein n=1 Tax=Trifolium pratense TaxID=57577 RepID=A0ACB0LCE9_TRIPR|nr:unnamed protein product [Trifolium pratense]